MNALNRWLGWTRKIFTRLKSWSQKIRRSSSQVLFRWLRLRLLEWGNYLQVGSLEAYIPKVQAVRRITAMRRLIHPHKLIENSPAQVVPIWMINVWALREDSTNRMKGWLRHLSHLTINATWYKRKRMRSRWRKGRSLICESDSNSNSPALTAHRSTKVRNSLVCWMIR